MSHFPDPLMGRTVNGVCRLHLFWRDGRTQVMNWRERFVGPRLIVPHVNEYPVARFASALGEPPTEEIRQVNFVPVREMIVTNFETLQMEQDVWLKEVE